MYLRGTGASQGSLVVKNLSANAGDIRDSGLIPGRQLCTPYTTNAGLFPESARSPGGWHGGPLQYSCVQHPMDREAW